MEEDFWDIIENNFGMYDVLDEDETNVFADFNFAAFKVFPIAPGIIIMIKDDYNG